MDEEAKVEETAFKPGEKREMTIGMETYRVRRRGADSQCELEKFEIKNPPIHLNNLVLVSKTEIFDRVKKDWRLMDKDDVERMEDHELVRLATEVNVLNKRKVSIVEDFRISSEGLRSQS